MQVIRRRHFDPKPGMLLCGAFSQMGLYRQCWKRQQTMIDKCCLQASDRYHCVLGHYLLFEAGNDHQLLDSAVIETNVLPVPPQQNWDATSPYYNLCQVLYCTPSHSSTPTPVGGVLIYLYEGLESIGGYNKAMTRPVWRQTYDYLSSRTAIWPVLISRPAEGRRLSWPEWLVTLLTYIPRRHTRERSIWTGDGRKNLALSTLTTAVARLQN